MGGDVQPVYPVELSLEQDAIIGWSDCKRRIGLLCYVRRYSFLLFPIFFLIGLFVMYRKWGFGRKFIIGVVLWIMISYLLMIIAAIVLGLLGGYFIMSDVTDLLKLYLTSPLIWLFMLVAD